MDYLPKTEAELVTWAANFARKLPDHAATLGLSETDIATARADADTLNYLTNTLIPGLRAKMREFTAYKNSMKDGKSGTSVEAPILSELPPAPAAVEPGIVARFRALVRQIKAASGFTDAIAQDLNIAAPEPPDSSEERPQFTAEPQPGHEVRIDFVKSGYDGVCVEGRYSGEETWTFLASDRYSPYLDSRAPRVANQPEVREYRLRYLDKDDPVGSYSDIVVVSTLP